MPTQIEENENISLPELLAAAEKGYGNAMGVDWKRLIDKNGNLKQHGQAGDSLVDYIITEIGNSYSSDASREEKIDAAADAIEKAITDLNDVALALRLLRQ